MKKFALMILFSFMVMLLSSSNCMAFWLIFYKSGYKGRILDAETKEPIKDAVVVAIYHYEPIICGPAGCSGGVQSVKETLTDEKGEFYLYPYLTLFNPFTVMGDTKFIIYKPGYKSYPGIIYPISHFGPYPEDFFTEDIGEKGEKRVWRETYPVTYGIVELPKRITREERLRAIPSRPTDMRADDLPLLFKSINEERKKFGLDEVG